MVVSLFVNPAQFGEPGGSRALPRDLRDIAMAEAAGVDILFTPAVGEIYAVGFDTWVEVAALSTCWRCQPPEHFRGVATICLKLFNIVQPDAV